MTPALLNHPITAQWPPQHPERLQLYSLATPNGVKVSIALEEMGLPYEAHTIRFERNDQFHPAFLALNPNNKIPAILDPHGPGGQPLALFESGAILMYLAEKTGQFLPTDPAQRYTTLQWLMWQMGGFGPMLGQNHHFSQFAAEKIPYAIERYVNETKRLYGVLNTQLTGQKYVAGEYSIADMAILPWILSYAWQQIQIDDYPYVKDYMQRLTARPAVQRALAIQVNN